MYTITIDNKPTTRANRIYENKAIAEEECNSMNAKARNMGINTRYQLTPCDEGWKQQNEVIVSSRMRLLLRLRKKD